MSAAAPLTIGPVMPSEGSERQGLTEVERFLAQRPDDGSPMRLVAGDGVEVPVPALLVEVLHQLAAALARGDGVVMSPVAREMSTTDAARVLRMSRPTLIRLLDAGEIPSRRVGTHRRIAAGDVLAYRRQLVETQLRAYEDLMLAADEARLVEE